MLWPDSFIGSAAVVLGLAGVAGLIGAYFSRRSGTSFSSSFAHAFSSLLGGSLAHPPASDQQWVNPDLHKLQSLRGMPQKDGEDGEAKPS